MPLEFAMLSESLSDKEAIEIALQQNWEPFSVWDGRVFFRRQFHNEDREPLSSTRHKNAAGNEEDRSWLISTVP
jgi:hypothetical protein